MKLLIICLEEEKERANVLRLLLDKMAIYSGILLAKSQEGGRRNIEKQFFAFFNLHVSDADAAKAPVDDKALDVVDETPTHVMIISNLAPEWVDFLAGFACGSRVPFLAYGKDAKKCVPDVYSFFFKILENKDALRSYLNTESEIFKKRETDRETQKARDTLLEEGIPVNNNSLAQCVAEGQINEVALFFSAGFSPSVKDKTGIPLLNIAARKGNRDITRLLLDAGADINLLADDRGTSALIDSVMVKQYDLMMDLIKAGADLNVQSKDKQTALIVAVGADQINMVEALVKAGADPDISDSMGMSARTYASLFRKTAITEIFKNNAQDKKD